MKRFATRIALLGSVGALALAGAAPAQEVEVPSVAVSPGPCLKSLDVPTCVNAGFTTASQAVELVRGLYESTGRRYVCDVHWILTGETCP